MDAQQKIWAWCDRREAETDTTCALMVYRAKRLGELTGVWFAGIREYRMRKLPHDPYIDATWLPIEGRNDWIDDREGETPESAIASLAKALGL